MHKWNKTLKLESILEFVVSKIYIPIVSSLFNLAMTNILKFYLNACACLSIGKKNYDPILTLYTFIYFSY